MPVEDSKVTEFNLLVRAGATARDSLRAYLMQTPSILDQHETNSAVSLIDTYMFEAMEEHDLSGMESLLSAGLDPNHVRRGHGEGVTLLMSASYSNEPRLVSLLLQHGADPNKGDEKGWTPLMFAVALSETLATDAQTSAAVVRLLLAAGARKAARNACGHTAEDILSFQQGYCSPDEIDSVANALRKE